MDGWWISPIWCSRATIFRLKHFLPRSIFPNQAVNLNLIAEKSAWVPCFKKGGGIGVLGTFGEVFGFRKDLYIACIWRIYIYIYMYLWRKTTKHIRKKESQNLPRHLFFGFRGICILNRVPATAKTPPPGVEIRTKPGDKSGHWAAAKSWDPWGFCHNKGKRFNAEIQRDFSTTTSLDWI